MRGRIVSGIGASIAVAGAALSWSAAALAQEAASGDQLEEVIVTAERRSENVEKTPLAIDVVTSSELQDRHITNGSEIIGLTPGVNLYNERGGDSIYIRGIGNDASNPYADPDVTIYADGVSVSSVSQTEGLYFDVNRIEVLKGPQGTLYGRNATAGAINIITNDPQPTYSASAEVRAGNYNLMQTDGTLNIPFSSTFAMRGAFETVHHTGYFSDGHGDEDDQSGRIKALWNPNDSLTIHLEADYNRLGGLGDQQVPVVGDLAAGTAGAPGPNAGKYYWETVQPGANPWTVGDSYPVPGGVTNLISAASHDIDRNYGYSATVDWNLGFGTLTAIPAYRESQQDWNDTEIGFGFIQRVSDAARTLEVRLASNDTPASKLKWVVGGYYLYETLPNYVDVQQSFPAAGSGIPEYHQITGTPQDFTRSYAGFGQMTWSFTSAARLTLGLRYTNDYKKEVGYTTNDTVPPASPPTAPPVPYTFQENWVVKGNSVDPHVGFDFDLTKQSMLYANFSTGYKVGGFSAGPTPGLTPGLSVDPGIVPLLTYKPERIRAYDVGIKNQLFDNRLQINAEAFYWHYTNQQVQTIFLLFLPNPYGVVVVPSVVNAGKAYDEGVDLDVAYQPTHSDKLTASVEWLHTKYQSFSYPNVFFNNINSADAGKPFVNAPTLAGNLGYRHTWDLANGGSVHASVNSQITGGYWIPAYTYDPYVNWQKSYSKTALDVGYSSDQKWEADLWVKNLENVAVRTNAHGTVPGNATGPAPTANANGTPPGLYWSELQPPRTYGVSLNFRL